MNQKNKAKTSVRLLPDLPKAYFDFNLTRIYDDLDVD